MKKITIRSAEFCIESEDLIRVTLFDNIEFERSDADELFNVLKQLTSGKNFYVLTQLMKVLLLTLK